MPIVSKIPAIVKEVVKYSETVATYTFEPQKRIPRFKPGQFLHLAIDAYDPSKEWPESRVFSILSSPTNQETIKLIISAKGNFTNRVLNTLKEGDEVWLKLPYGDFTFDNNDNNIVLVAGGTGIAPFVSYLDNAMNSINNKSITLYYGVRFPELIIFENVLKKYQKDLNGFNMKLFIENPGQYNQLPFDNGILDIHKIYSDNKDSSFYLSGPLGMIKSFRQELLNKGVSLNKIIIDSWE